MYTHGTCTVYIHDELSADTCMGLHIPARDEMNIVATPLYGNHGNAVTRASDDLIFNSDKICCMYVSMRFNGVIPGQYYVVNMGANARTIFKDNVST